MRQNRFGVPLAAVLGLGVILPTLAGAVGPSARAGTIDEACLARLKAEARPRWAAAARLMDDIEVECRELNKTETVGKDGKPDVQKHEFEWTISWDVPNARRLVDLHTIHAG